MIIESSVKMKTKIENMLNGKLKYLLLQGDCLELLREFPDEIVSCVITSPPYWKMREYEITNDSNGKLIGNEEDIEDYINKLTLVFAEIKRILKKDGSFWLNIGDKYLNKNLLGIPWRVALALQKDSWILRNDIIWDQMKGTQSAKDRLRDVYEHVFHFVKNSKYYYAHNEIRIKPKKMASINNGVICSATGVSGVKYKQLIKDSKFLNAKEKENALKDLENILEKMRKNEIVDFRMTIRGHQRTFHSNNGKVSGRAKELEGKGYFFIIMGAKGFLPSDIWRIVPEDECRKDTHYAVFPEELLLNPIRATCPKNGIVLDPFSGIGSTICTALKLERKVIGLELSENYNEIAKKRIEEIIKKPRQLYLFESHCS